ncbi:unnamed protein product [Blepharisma stoltei]|uniref:Uncharacterized protein n=1 Tax=Blepharisma stoltei TaxID=1481888 RepID=A0AAU9JRF8_9CILI|nr:unnamed protein product [Blepharisma stoltei]
MIISRQVFNDNNINHYLCAQFSIETPFFNNFLNLLTKFKIRVPFISKLPNSQYHKIKIYIIDFTNFSNNQHIVQ